MGEDLITCDCGECTSNYSGYQCKKCHNFFCSRTCAVLFCCTNILSKENDEKIKNHKSIIENSEKMIIQIRKENKKDLKNK